MKFKSNLISLIFSLLFIFPVFAGKVGSGENKQDYNVAITDQRSGNTAVVDSDGYLQVEVNGGINGSFTASNVAVSALVPGTGATNAGKAEDDAESDGMTVVAVGTVRRDAAATSAGTDGDISTLNTDATGNLWTVLGSQFAEDAAHTTADKGIGILAVRDNAPLAAKTGTDGDYGNLSIDDVGNLYVRPNCSYAEDAAHNSGEYGTPALVVRADTAASLAGTDGDNTFMQVDATGWLRTTDKASYAEDSGHSSTDPGMAVLAVRKDTAGAGAGTDGDYANLQLDATGWLRVTDKTTYAEDAANTTADPGLHILGVRTDTLTSSSGTTGDYSEFNLSAEGALYVAGNKKEDAAHSSGDYMLPIGARRIDAATAASGGTAGDYVTLDVDAQGAVYVNNRRAATAVFGSVGDAAGGLTILGSAGAATKNRIYKITVSSAAAEVLTLTELANCTKLYTQAGSQTVYDFGFNGLLQTSAATAITATSADASACQVIVEYSTEAA